MEMDIEKLEEKIEIVFKELYDIMLTQKEEELEERITEIMSETVEIALLIAQEIGFRYFVTFVKDLIQGKDVTVANVQKVKEVGIEEFFQLNYTKYRLIIKEKIEEIKKKRTKKSLVELSKYWKEFCSKMDFVLCYL